MLWVTSKDMKRDVIDSTLITLSDKGAELLDVYPIGSIVMVTRSGILKRLLPVAVLAKEATVNQDQKVTIPIDPSGSLWLPIVFRSSDSYIRSELGKAGTTVESVNFEQVKKMLVPIPPIDEQNRISVKLRILLTHAERYDALETAREKLDAELPERLRKSILQMAVQGKLVPQDTSDEPASALLERIREERRKLIAEGKLKAPKGGESIIYRASDGGYYEKRIDAKGRESEPVCIDDEIPFEIPDSWEWVRLGSICSHIVDGDHNPPANSGKGIPILSAANVHNGKLHIDEAARWITEADYKKAYKRLSTSKGNVLMTIVGTIGRTAVLDTDEPFALQRSVSVIAQLCMIPQYLAYALESYTDYLQSISSGTAQKGIYLGTLSNLLIPIPSVNEQSRIYAALSEALPLITNQ